MSSPLCCFKTTSFNKWQDMDSKRKKKTSALSCAKCHALEAEAALTTSCLWTLCRSFVGLRDILKGRLHVSCQGNDTAEKTIATTTLLYLWVRWPFISLQPLMFRQSLAEVKRRDRDQTSWRSIMQLYSFFSAWKRFPCSLYGPLSLKPATSTGGMGLPLVIV